MQAEQPATILLPGALGEQGLALEGLYVPGEKPLAALIAAPHPLYGGRMENPVVTELALRLEQLHRPSLRFNWRGVGGSAGEPSGEMSVADEDYAAAFEFLAESAPGALIAAGYSFGSAAAIRFALSDNEHAARVRSLVLVAPPPAMIEAEALARFEGRVFVAVGDRDDFAPVDEVRKLVAPLDRVRLEILDETDHFFGMGTVDLGRAFESWMSDD